MGEGTQINAADVARVAAFSSGTLQGNPAGVWLFEAGSTQPDDAVLQACAAEVNLSETAFLSQVEGAADRFGLRWFTPKTEVDLCGHATLASAFYLWSEKVVSADVIAFDTLSGTLFARREGDMIWMDFPKLDVVPCEDLDVAELGRALGAEVEKCWRTQHDLLVPLRHEVDVFRLAPDIRALEKIETRGVLVTAATPGREYDFVSRFFAPRCGIDEDPVTGSAHCALAPFWGERSGLTEQLGYQASDRGGMVWTRIDGARVHLGGQGKRIR